MLKSYLKIAFRNLRKQRLYAFINVAGLAIGITSCLLILLYVRDELSYDRFHANADQIFRVAQETEDGGTSWVGPGMALNLKKDFPQIDVVVRVTSSESALSYRGGPNTAPALGKEHIMFADPPFFNLFSFHLIKGNPSTVLRGVGHVVLSERGARKYFGDSDPLGKTLVLDNTINLQVTGVVANPPSNSHLQFDFISTYDTYLARFGLPKDIDSFWWPQSWTYIRLHRASDATTISDNLAAFNKRYRPLAEAEKYRPKLQPLTDIHLYSHYSGEQSPPGSLSTIYIFSAIAVLVLILACINFTNLATARSAERAKEVGVRKTMGAARRQLIIQFLSETVLLSLLALSLAVILAEVLLPYFNELSGKELSIRLADDGALWIGIAAIVTLTGFLAGSYPAFLLSSYDPITVLKGAAGPRTGSTLFRKGLIVFQFTMSVTLIAGSTIIYQQLNYLLHADLGFDEEQLLVLRGEVGKQYETLKAELLRSPVVRQVSGIDALPGIHPGPDFAFEAEGVPIQAERRIYLQAVDYDFLSMLKLPIISGRAISRDFPADEGTARMVQGSFPTPVHEGRAFVINETAARQIGWDPEQAVGKRMRFYISENGVVYQDYRGSVVGVVKDYHTGSLRGRIDPTVYMPAHSPLGFYIMTDLLVKVAPGNARNIMAGVRDAWQRAISDQPFDATYLDQDIENLYSADVRMGRIVGIFTGLAVLIACFGLFGLASFTTERRTKEIGIRKVLGASVVSIVGLVSGEFARLLLISVVLSIPLALYGAQKWLANFAYHVEISWFVFLLAGIASLILAFLTVSYQAIKAALADPVKSLRYE